MHLPLSKYDHWKTAAPERDAEPDPLEEFRATLCKATSAAQGVGMMGETSEWDANRLRLRSGTFDFELAAYGIEDAEHLAECLERAAATLREEK